MKEIALLGSTGSIGTQTLDVIRMHKDRFHASVLAAYNRIDQLLLQAEEFQPHCIAVTDEEAGKAFLRRYDGPAEVLMGDGALLEAVRRIDVDLVAVSVVGIVGLAPTLEAIRQGKNIALANKETLVTGGELVTKAADEGHVLLRPVDSEHSAIFQCLLGQDKQGVHRLILTASGGPFLGWSREALGQVTLSDCLRHPTWNMGRKVTIDSATMFNKGLEIIEAHWLFRIPYDRIQVVIQPQSLIHSMVEYEDGSILAQVGNPDMRIPIQFALTYPERLPTPNRSFVEWDHLSQIVIQKPDTEVFRSLPMAYEAGKTGGDMTAALNAADEEAVAAFVQGRLSFLQIFDVVEAVLHGWQARPVQSVGDILEADQRARAAAKAAIRRMEG